MRHWVVTGGAGFIGSHLVEALLAAGDRVTVIDDFSSGRREFLAAVQGHSGLRLLAGDVRAPDLFAAAMAGPVDGVFHLAARVHVQDCIADWLGGHAANAGTTLMVMAAAADRGPIPLVYASTAAVYGDCGTALCREDRTPVPLSPYGADKLACEHHGRAFHGIRGLPSAGLRLFNVYGPRQDAASPYAGVIARYVSNIEGNLTHEIHGDGGQTRDFVHVSDAVRALRAAMDRLHRHPDAVVCNVCTGRALSVHRIAALIDDLAGRPHAVRRRPARAGDIRHSQGCPARMADLLGLTDMLPLEAGLAGLLRPEGKARRIA